MAGNANVKKRTDIDSKSNPLPQWDPAKTTESLLAISRYVEGHASAPHTLPEGYTVQLDGRSDRTGSASPGSPAAS